MSSFLPASPWLVRLLAFSASGLLTLNTAAAQSPSNRLSIRPDADPINAQAAVPAAVHRSAIATYRGAEDQTVGTWREANQTVNRIGGWRTYAKERPIEEAPTAPANPPRPAGHIGHDMGKKR